jgi:phosphoglucomutase
MSFLFSPNTISHSALMGAFDSLVLSASGWRGIFAASANEEDSDCAVRPEFLALAALMADSFADYVQKNAVVVLGRDTRPTGEKVALAMFSAFLNRGLAVEYLGIVCAPEIMAYARSNFPSSAKRYFAYVSASHNPVGHNGVKFGFDGGVIAPDEEQELRGFFIKKCSAHDAVNRTHELLRCGEQRLIDTKTESFFFKKKAYDSYLDFARLTAGIERKKTAMPPPSNNERKAVAADFNGSARGTSIDRQFFEEQGYEFFAFNEEPGVFAHGIIPEAGNLEYAARFLEQLHEGRCEKFPGIHTEAEIAYACDCDGDRGNIVYYSKKNRRAEILSAQEVFSLCVLASLSLHSPRQKQAVVCNCPTSMRVDEIARAFDAEIFRAEVGEANVVSLAQKTRGMGFDVRAAGEGSNGGNIVHPSRVRDPLNTVWAILALLDRQNGAFKTWLKKIGREHDAQDFSLDGIIESLPAYTTTGVSEERAKLAIKTRDHAALKRNFQKEFEAWFDSQKNFLAHNGIVSWSAVGTNGTEETKNLRDFGLSERGGLKILLLDSAGKSQAFMWMRGSGTENVFRVLCDVKGKNNALESQLLDAERALLLKADKDTP